MKWRVCRPTRGIPLLAGCLLVFLLAACGTVTKTGAGNSLPTATSYPSPTATTQASTPTVQLVLTFVCEQDFVSGDQNHERVCVQTLPGAALTITVTYCTGSVDESPALKGAFTADQSGYYEWGWKPEATCQGNPPGSNGFWKGNAEVTASLGGQTITSDETYEA